MTRQRITRYQGLPDDILPAFMQDVESKDWRVVSTSWNGPQLLVVWENVHEDYTSGPLGLLAALGAAGLFAWAGLQLVALRSQAGNTVAEAFYQGVGWMAFGLAVLALTVGFKR